MSTPKPRIRPKADPLYRRMSEPPRDPPAYPEHDPGTPLPERRPGVEQKLPERVIFQEDDCLR